MNRRAGLTAGLAAAAIALAAGCASPSASPATDRDVASYASAARTAFDRGALEQAAPLYLRALKRARSLDAAAEIANQSYNLAACLIALRDYADAEACLREARAESQRRGTDPTDLALLEIEAARGAGRAAEATERADRLIAKLAAPGSDPIALAAARVLKAQLACDAGDAPAARALLAEIDRQPADNPQLAASRAGLAGRIALLDKDFAAAAGAFDREAEACRRVGRFREMARALGRAGTAYQQAGDARQAGERLYRAARSLDAQGDSLGALQLVAPALQAAEQAGDRELQQLVAALFADIRQRTRGPAAPKAKNQPGRTGSE